MIFLSGGFLLLVGALLIIYYVLPKRFRYLALLGGSVVFYTLAGRAYLPFLGITVLTVYGTALLLGRSLERQKAYVAEHKKELTREAVAAYKKRESGKRTALFLVCLVLNLGLLAALKYTAFLLDAFRAPWEVHWVLPLGISFYTFQSLGYLMDVKRGKYPPERNFLRYALFASFFPQMIQGPISRYDMLSKTLYEGADFDIDRIGRGLVRILWGAAKKPGYSSAWSSTPSGSTPTSPAASTWPSGWGSSSASPCRRTSIGPISPKTSRNTGPAGT